MTVNQDPTAEPTAADPSTLSYEVAKGELRQIVSSLETGSVPLEQTLELWKRGEALAARCRSILEMAASQIDSVTSSSATQNQ